MSFFLQIRNPKTRAFKVRYSALWASIQFSRRCKHLKGMDEVIGLFIVTPLVEIRQPSKRGNWLIGL